MLGGRRVTVDASNTLAYAAGMRPRVLDLLIDYAVDDAVRKPIQEVPLRAEEAGPTLRRCDDLRDRVVYREDELPTQTAASSFVESCAEAEVEDRLVVDAAGLLRSRHGARRGSRP